MFLQCIVLSTCVVNAILTARGVSHTNLSIPTKLISEGDVAVMIIGLLFVVKTAQQVKGKNKNSNNSDKDRDQNGFCLSGNSFLLKTETQ